MTSIIKQSLGGTFSTPPVAVSLPGATPIESGPPKAVGFQARVAAPACDGMVALEQDVLLGTDIALATAGGKVHSVTTEHPGTTSADGCGPTSQYQVQWSITQV